jgi:hypothetical protein
MNSRTRTKLVANAILAFLALGLAILGGAVALSGWGQRDFLLHGDAEALSVCLHNPAMDCDPRHWPVLAGVGGGLLVLGLLPLVRIARRMRRLLRS